MQRCTERLERGVAGWINGSSGKLCVDSLFSGFSWEIPSADWYGCPDFIKLIIYFHLFYPIFVQWSNMD
jgi:hypothetical protein